jgi:pyocin large subunit-like protein
MVPAVALKSKGFSDPYALRSHFAAHQAEFSFATSAEYEEAADKFLTGTKRGTTKEGRRRNGDLVRYDVITEEFGVMSSGKVIRTYFIPDPADHNFTTNLDYFKHECKK